MGRAHERLLTIDGDYIHIMAGEHKNIFDTMKTVSFFNGIPAGTSTDSFDASHLTILARLSPVRP